MAHLACIQVNTVSPKWDKNNDAAVRNRDITGL